MGEKIKNPNLERQLGRDLLLSISQASPSKADLKLEQDSVTGGIKQI